MQELLMPTDSKRLRPLNAREGRHLADFVRSLDADRGQLLARVAMLEQRVVDITESILRVETAAQPAPPTYSTAPVEPTPPTSAPDKDVTSNIPLPPQPPGPNTAKTELDFDLGRPTTVEAPRTASTYSAAPLEPTTTAPGGDVTSSVPVPSQQPPGPNTAKTEFGLDLGSATTIEALRTAWTAALRQHGALLEGLRPLVQIHETRPTRIELRLVAGPVPDAAAAARLCLAMTTAKAICAPAIFEGQRLPIRPSTNHARSSGVTGQRQRAFNSPAVTRRGLDRKE
jgi:hypothetical protein